MSKGLCSERRLLVGRHTAEAVDTQLRRLYVSGLWSERVVCQHGS